MNDVSLLLNVLQVAISSLIAPTGLCVFSCLYNLTGCFLLLMIPSTFLLYHKL